MKTKLLLTLTMLMSMSYSQAKIKKYNRPTLPPLPENFPKGSYGATCFDCTMQGSNLSCTCFQENESIYTKGIDTSKCQNGTITNEENVLCCTSNTTGQRYCSQPMQQPAPKPRPK